MVPKWSTAVLILSSIETSDEMSPWRVKRLGDGVSGEGRRSRAVTRQPCAIGGLARTPNQKKQGNHVTPTKEFLDGLAANSPRSTSDENVVALKTQERHCC
jgi:hypothetical protein